MAGVPIANKKLTVPLGIAAIILLAGVALAAGLHNGKPAKTQPVEQAASANHKQSSPSISSVLGASTDVPGDTTDGAVAPSAQGSPSSAPVVVGASSDATIPVSAVPAVTSPADNNNGDQTTGGMGAGDQTSDQPGGQNQGDQTGDEQSGDQGNQPEDDQSGDQGDDQADGSDSTNNTPAPQPSFHLTFHPELAYILPSHPYPGQVLTAGFTEYAIPYDITYDEGFVPDPMQFPWYPINWPSCEFLVTPTTDHGVNCTFSQRWDVLIIQYDDTSATGHYEVETTYSLNGQEQVNTVDFDIE